MADGLHELFESQRWLDSSATFIYLLPSANVRINMWEKLETRVQGFVPDFAVMNAKDKA